MEKHLIKRNDLNCRTVNYLLIGMAVSLFIFNEITRTMLSKNTLNLNYNVLFFVISVLTIYLFLYNEHIDIAATILCLAITSLAFLSFISVSVRITLYIKFFITMVIPLLIIGFRLPAEDFKYFFLKFLKLYNIAIILLVLIGLIDYLSGARIQVFLAENRIFYEDHAALVMREHASGIYRYYSVLGHPLQNAWYVLVFYVLNILSSRSIKQMLNENTVLVFTVLGLLISGSRTAFVIGLLLCIFLNNRKQKLLFFMLFLVACAGFLSTPLFQENLWLRFTVDSGSFSGGRNEALAFVFNGNLEPPGFIWGGGPGYSRQVIMTMGFAKSFEYPLIMLAYDLGIIGVALFYFAIFIYPVLIFVKNKSYYVLFLFGALSLYVNGFNDLANYSDSIGQFCFIAMILINISYVIKESRRDLA